MLKKYITLLYKSIFYRSTIRLFKVLIKRNVFNEIENSNYQINKLTLVLKNSIEKVPYYRDFHLHLDYNNFSYKDFQKIPILTKDIIRKKGDLLINVDFEKTNEVFRNTSGGSTGEPVTFYQTKSQMVYGSANYFLALHYNGVDINENMVSLWGAERDMHKPNAKFNIRTLLHNTITLNTFVMSDAIMLQYVKQLNVIKPKFIKAYVHSIYDLSKFINKHKIKINFKPVIHCTTGPLYPEIKIEIEKAFNDGNVYNFYGSREVSAIATEVVGNKGMFILYDNVFIEILDKDNQPVRKGEEGEIVVTTLNNSYMPLLRYKIGDRGIKGDDLEFGSLKLDAVIGRTLGVIHKSDGSKIDGQFFTTLFFDKKGINNFQLIQKTISELQLNIVKSDSFNLDDLDSIIKRIEKELGAVKINTVFCDKINLTSTGKIMYVFSEIKY
jgi:phenylacetate-CoA ligase